MFKREDKNKNRKARHIRVRKKVFGSKSCPRLNVYKSLTGIYAQIIDDFVSNTLVSASSKDKEISNEVLGKNKTEQAKIVGKLIAKRAIAKDIKKVVFDRGGYIYTGRIKALADAARENGLEF